MFREMQKAIVEQYSGQRAKEYITEIIQYHRIQCSPGFRAAAQRCQEILAGFGVSAEVLTFPAREGVSYWALPMFQEWEASEATLHLIDPADKARKLADFQELKCSLIQRSAPVDHLETDVVVLEDGEEDDEYKNLDVQGKVVLTKGDLERVCELAVQRHGAVGILYDGMRDIPPVRQRIDMPDTRAYTSFWWRPGQRTCFGFVLTPRQGEELRRLVKSQQREGKPLPAELIPPTGWQDGVPVAGRGVLPSVGQGSTSVRVRARVVSRLYDGQMEIVSALIPGQTDEEVLVVAHLCHPQTSANDNASGCAAALELARSLQHLIEDSKLPRPRRGIRILLLAEMTGTFAYLATHEEAIPRMVAGINLDMVGENQDLCGSVFIVERPPAAMPSFVADLLERLRQEWLAGAQNPSSSATYPLFRHAVTPFSGGSDHYILSDPSVGVPTPMLIQWPDKFWHTSDDTLDKVDPRMLGVLGSLATVYAYFVANAGEREALWLGHEMLTKFRARLAQGVQDALTEALSTADVEKLATAAPRIERTIRFQGERQREAMRSLLRLSPQMQTAVAELCSAVDRSVDEESERARTVLRWQARQCGLEDIPTLPTKATDEWECQAAQMVPSRLYRGPLSVGGHLHRLPTEERDELRAWIKPYQQVYYGMSTIADYWVDGKRSVAEIADLTEMETGQRKAQLLVRHFRLLARLGLVAVQLKLTAP
jgi:hypothetical protein